MNENFTNSPLYYLKEGVQHADYMCTKNCCTRNNYPLVNENLDQLAYETFHEEVADCYFSWVEDYSLYGRECTGRRKFTRTVEVVNVGHPVIIVDLEKFQAAGNNIKFTLDTRNYHSITVQNYHNKGVQCILYSVKPFLKDFHRFVVAPCSNPNFNTEKVLKKSYFENVLLMLLQGGNCKAVITLDTNWKRAIYNAKPYFELLSIKEHYPYAVFLPCEKFEKFPPYLRIMPSFGKLLCVLDLVNLIDFPIFLERLWILIQALEEVDMSIALFACIGLANQDIVMRILVWPMVTPVVKVDGEICATLKVDTCAMQLAGIQLITKSKNFEYIARHPFENGKDLLAEPKSHCMSILSKYGRRVINSIARNFEERRDLDLTESEKVHKLYTNEGQGDSSKKSRNKKGSKSPNSSKK